MLALRFAHIILRSRFNAILCALIFALLPYLGWVSGAVIALVTLRKGKMEGFLILLWSLLPGLCLAIYTKTWLPFIFSVVFSSILLWCIAVLLRYRASLSGLLYVVILFDVIGVLVFHLVMSNPAAFWLNELNASLQQLDASLQAQLKPQNVQTAFQLFSKMATGLKIAGYSFLALMSLFFGRMMDYLLAHPKGMSREFRVIRLNVIASMILIACLIVAKTGPAIFIDFVPVMLMPFVIAGVSLTHALVMRTKSSRAWLMFYYFILMIMVFFMPPLMLFFVGLAVLDSIINIRRWVKGHSSSTT